MRNLIIFLLALAILLALPFGLKAEDTIYNTACCDAVTTVHRKVQIWLTPDELKKFKEMLK